MRISDWSSDVCSSDLPTNPLLKLVDLDAVATSARQRGILAACDNTFATPWVQRPLELGFDVVMHSATKYLNGHSDMVGGILVVGDNAALADQLSFLQNAVGAVQGPFDSFLALRGLKTLALRMERHCSNAMRSEEHTEEHTSELQSLMRISYAVFCMKKKKACMPSSDRNNQQIHTHTLFSYRELNTMTNHIH